MDVDDVQGRVLVGDLRAKDAAQVQDLLDVEIAPLHQRRVEDGHGATGSWIGAKGAEDDAVREDLTELEQVGLGPVGFLKGEDVVRRELLDLFEFLLEFLVVVVAVDEKPMDIPSD